MSTIAFLVMIFWALAAMAVFQENAVLGLLVAAPLVGWIKSGIDNR